MFKTFQTACEGILRIPPDPETPPGDEATTRIFRASPNFYKYLLIDWGIKTVVMLLVALAMTIPAVAGGLALRRTGHDWGLLLFLVPCLALPAAVLLSLFLLAVLRLAYEKRWYIVTDRCLRIREGVVQVAEMTITHANIQNISTSQGPLQRLLGIADLKVETAGGGGGDPHSQHATQNLHTAYFRGIDNAEEVKAVIQRQFKHLLDSGLGHREEARRPVSAPDGRAAALLHEIHTELVGMRKSLES